MPIAACKRRECGGCRPGSTIVRCAMSDVSAINSLASAIAGTTKSSVASRSGVSLVVPEHINREECQLRLLKD